MSWASAVSNTLCQRVSSRGDELKQYRHIPAAGHAETVRPGLRQGEVLYLGTPLLQQGQGQQLGLPLYLPAADSAR
ncbi:MAG: hypothetical protein V8R21_04930 [Dysosmobacter sp.]